MSKLHGSMLGRIVGRACARRPLRMWCFSSKMTLPPAIASDAKPMPCFQSRLGQNPHASLDPAVSRITLQMLQKCLQMSPYGGIRSCHRFMNIISSHISYPISPIHSSHRKREPRLLHCDALRIQGEGLGQLVRRIGRVILQLPSRTPEHSKGWLFPLSRRRWAQPLADE